MRPNTVLVLNGSPKRGMGSSRALADHLASGLEGRGLTVLRRDLLRDMKNDMAGLLSDCDRADLIVLSFPLYVDCLPAHVVAWMEQMSGSGIERRGRSFLAIGQCGNPDPAEIDIAMEILQNFARGMGFRWAGGLRMGMGPILQGKELREAGGTAKHAIAGLDAALNALEKGEAVTDEAAAEFSQRAVPTFLFLMLANRMWKKESKRHGARRKLMDRPFGR